MRMLVIVRAPHVPMQDQEMASRMIRLFEQAPRSNHRLPVAALQIGEWIGGLVLAAVGVVLAGLLFTV